ncbi:hypothetical protein [Streptomyces avidinii]|uniref:Uncharacterized protein n=1 Tax=Streptomyces avidinii TaxID=1895 RepID=A0ABS4L3N1_STRAV|nr:hypothetical protein [Streptomyces avidinii]MBP2036705.1 hypothetical protein [Streptomyces avidinii]
MHFTAIMGLKITEPPPNYDKRTRTNDAARAAGGVGGAARSVPPTRGAT